LAGECRTIGPEGFTLTFPAVFVAVQNLKPSNRRHLENVFTTGEPAAYLG
jgi:hypothetical protein